MTMPTARTRRCGHERLRLPPGSSPSPSPRTWRGPSPPPPTGSPMTTRRGSRPDVGSVVPPAPAAVARPRCRGVGSATPVLAAPGRAGAAGRRRGPTGARSGFARRLRSAGDRSAAVLAPRAGVAVPVARPRSPGQVRSGAPGTGCRAAGELPVRPAPSTHDVRSGTASPGAVAVGRRSPPSHRPCGAPCGRRPGSRAVAAAPATHRSAGGGAPPVASVALAAASAPGRPRGVAPRADRASARCRPPRARSRGIARSVPGVAGHSGETLPGRGGRGEVAGQHAPSGTAPTRAGDVVVGTGRNRRRARRPAARPPAVAPVVRRERRQEAAGSWSSGVGSSCTVVKSDPRHHRHVSRRQRAVLLAGPRRR